MSVTLQIDSPYHPQVVALVEQLDSYLQALYPAESNHLVSIDALAQPNVLFCTVRAGGEVVGCGAALIHAAGYAELKRMSVAASHRGQGLGRRIVEFLEAELVRRGITVARLETGINQAEAIGLYERCGYYPIPPFGEYREDPLSVFYEKQLAAPSRQ
ncbi:MAG: GNAT family N-acetyltransferase [Caldilineaceae bacterium]|nr:GNAT family N-acetyltransferase [Caldilineaceae bacterium]